MRNRHKKRKNINSSIERINTLAKKKKSEKMEMGLDVLKLMPIAKTDEQSILLDAISNNDITFVYGPPGTGKTFLSSLFGIFSVYKGMFEKLILTRPCVEANGERLGFLPGSLSEKLEPYLFPIFDILGRKIIAEEMKKLITNETIKTIPLSFLRGVTFFNSYVVVDEAQNTTKEQMRLLLTRIGERSKIVITGDINQSDIKGNNGLLDAIDRFKDMEHIKIVELTKKSIIRNPIIAGIEERYEKD